MNLIEQRPVAHLLCGFVGSGKTTFAKRLESDAGAIRFTVDEWFVQRHGQFPPAHTFKRCFEAVEAAVWNACIAKLRSGNDIILDAGLWSRRSRDDARQRVQHAGAIPKPYNVTCALETMRARTRERTANMPPGSLWIDEAGFETLLLRFEPLSDDEEHVRVDGASGLLS